MHVGLDALAIACVAAGLAGCVPSTNEERAQDYIDREYGAGYNVLGCGADGLFDNKGTIVECAVYNMREDREWTITVEFDGDGGQVVRVDGMP